MATIQEQILDSFYAKLAESKTVDAGTLDGLRALFQAGKKLKADDLVAIFSKPNRGGQS